MRESRKAYVVTVGEDGGELPTLTTYDCVLTAKQIAVYEEGSVVVLAYHRREDYTPAWTVREAWSRFLDAQNRIRQRGLAYAARAAERMAIAEQTLAALPEDPRICENGLHAGYQTADCPECARYR